METLWTVTVAFRTHRVIQEWVSPGTNGGAYMVLAACGSTLYPRDGYTLRVAAGAVTCPDCNAR